ncbi:MAG TPA: CHAD domain-containing protein [Thermoanaerobaculia bacterium]|nr:CHAD domain-containing protein [Thermoanaerobaculia bacterium]
MAESFDESPEILERSPEEGAHRLALGYLDQAAAALPRLADPDDAEALHDLRVALRRLRSCLKSYAAQLGDSVPKKLARRLRRLAGATGPGRDAEVQLAWLRARGPDLRSHHHRQGLAWLRARLQQRRDEAYGELRDEVTRDFAPVEEGLRRRLSVYRAEVRLGENPPPAFGDAAAEALLRHAAKLGHRLGRIRNAGDVERAHAARIGAKRLRYLADPLAHLVQANRGQPRTEPLVHRLKGLQDLLGELHDAHVQEAELAAAVGEAADERARRLLELTLAGGTDDHLLRVERRRANEPGLLALARLNRERRDRLFGQFAERWQGERVEQLLAAAAELAAALRAAGHAGAAGGAAAGGPAAGGPAAAADGLGGGDRTGGEGGGEGEDAGAKGNTGDGAKAGAGHGGGADVQ